MLFKESLLITDVMKTEDLVFALLFMKTMTMKTCLGPQTGVKFAIYSILCFMYYFLCLSSIFCTCWSACCDYKGKREREREVVCGQVWWPILGICPLHLTHPSAHSQQWTHTRSSGQPYCGARGAVGGSVPCSRVSPQSWYWRWREHLLFTYHKHIIHVYDKPKIIFHFVNL